jgi:hypothetical protein
MSSSNLLLSVFGQAGPNPAREPTAAGGLRALAGTLAASPLGGRSTWTLGLTRTHMQTAPRSFRPFALSQCAIKYG